MQQDELNTFQSKSDLPNLLNLYRVKIENSGVEFCMSHRVTLPSATYFYAKQVVTSVGTYPYLLF